MRIAIDLQCCQSGSRLGGIGRYSLDLARAMISVAKQDEILILLNDRHPGTVNTIRSALQDILPPENIFVFSVPAGCAYLTGDHGLRLASELIREKFIADIDLDVIHIASLIEGLAEEIVGSVARLPSRALTAVTLYDLIPMVNPQIYLSSEPAKRHYFEKISMLERADLLLAISEYSAQEGRELLKKVRGNISNISGGISPHFFAQGEQSNSMKTDVLGRYGITKPFLMYTGSFDQRKNQEGLIRACAALPPVIRKAHQLVIVGNGWPGAYERLSRVGEAAGMDRSDIIFTGRVEDDQLLDLYRNCRLFVFPSLWEGLGLPVIEAMALGAPVICSNTTSLPELLPDMRASFDPRSTDDIAAKIGYYLSDDEAREELGKKGAEHAKQFTWDRSARRALQAMKSACETRQIVGVDRSVLASTCVAELSSLSLSDIDKVSAARSLASNEAVLGARWTKTAPPRVGWVTTWGTRCGIATYSQNITSYLKIKPNIFAPHAEERNECAGLHVTSCWTQGKSDDLAALARAVATAGLDELMIQFNFGFFDFGALNRLICKVVEGGTAVSITMHSTVDPPDAPNEQQLAFLTETFHLASRVFVHGAKDMERLSSLVHPDKLRLLPHGVRVYSLRKPKRESNRIRLASYGFFLPGKGLIELIEATARLISGGRDVELLMVNAEYGDPGGISSSLIAESKHRIKELGLTDRFHIVTDFLEDEDSLSYLTSADLLVFPYQRSGESASGAVRVGLSSGRPVAVTPIPIFEELDGVVYKLPGTSVAAIAAGINAYLEAIDNKSTALEAVQTSARNWLRTHDYEVVVPYLEREMRLSSLGVTSA